ncbi:MULTISPECIES: tripartite tricarboxylate transporter substrate-binding protein [Ramlibacter]|uniref:tripartite tricarboxylate transporter substrate-binding protein n=1 Tax=Ramlibacter TaxID=174951 RepID=UPI0012F9E696|nr:tripartite tricarboxylate transporter substrate binding protein [Ramlibacter sp. CGMCC 1.13660]
MNSIRRVLAALAIGATCAGGTALASDAWPAKPIRIVVPTAAGGTVDIVTRLVAKGLAEDLRQPVIVDNKPSASGLIASREVAHAQPDGYTLLAVANTFVSAPAFVPQAGYDPIKDFEPVTQLCQIPMVLVVNPTVPERSVQALIERAKAHPGEVSFASSGTGSTGYIAAELFSRRAGIKMLSVSYKGNSQALVDVVGGQVMTMFDQVSTSWKYVRGKQLHALAVTTPTRSPLLPEVPTVAESGLPGYEDVTFNAILAPAGTPAPIVSRLHAAIAKVLARPALREQLSAQGIEVKSSETPQAFGEYLRSAASKYRGIAQAQ